MIQGTVNKLLPIDLLQPHPRNFRMHPQVQIAQLRKSYQRFGQFRSVVAQESPSGYLMVAGHGIVEAMKKEGVKEVRVDILPADVPAEEVEAILIADNYLSSLSEDNRELLTELLQEQDQQGYDIETLGFDKETLAQMLLEFTGEGEEESGNLLELLDITIADPRHEVHAGDVWMLEQHILFCVDVFRDWAVWTPYLKSSNHLFLPFTGPLVALSDAAKKYVLVMVQPDTYIAGHILDRYADIHGEKSVKKMMTVEASNSDESDITEDEYDVEALRDGGWND